MAKAKKTLTETEQDFIDTTMDQTSGITVQMISDEALHIDQIMLVVRRFAMVKQEAHPEYVGLEESIIETAATEIFAHCMLGE